MSLATNIFATSTLIFAIAQLMQSIQPSYALNPSNINTGSNPIVNINGKLYMNSVTTTTIWTNTTQNDFIVTTILQNTTACRITINGQTDGLVEIYDFSTPHDNKPSSAFISGNAKLLVSAGSTIDLRKTNTNGNNCHYYIEGYYVHP